MNTNVPSKISTFDFFAKFIPGCFIIYAVSRLTKDSLLQIDKIAPWFYYIFIFSLCYISGIIWNYIIETITNKILNLRGNSKWLASTLEKHKNENEIKQLFGDRKDLINSIIKNPKADEEIIKDYYFTAYYYVMRNNYRDAISHIESQVALLRNSFIPLVIVGTVIQEHNTICIFLPLLLISLLSFFIIKYIIIKLQKKIYALIWEDYIYIKRTIDSEKVSGNI